MHKIGSLLTLFAILLAACAPAAADTPTEPGSPASAAQIPSVTAAPPTAEPTVSGSVEASPAPQATSRGDALFASDPASVSFGNGKPALVEFFRFT